MSPFEHTSHAHILQASMPEYASPVTQAIILAAGRGSRMGGLTEHQPKCLVSLHGRPLLAWTIEALRANGIRDILIVTGWQHQALTGWGDELRVNTAWACSNMVRSLMLAQDWLLRAPSLVVYGDGAYGRRCLQQALCSSLAADWLVPIDRLWAELWQRRFTHPLDDAEGLIRDGDRLRAIGQRQPALTQVQGQFMGLLHLKPAAWQQASHWLNLWQTQHGTAMVDHLDMTGLLQRLLDVGVSMQCVEVDGGWVEIDNPDDLLCVEQGLKEAGFSHDFRI